MSGWPEPYIYIRCIYGVVGRAITEYTVIYGVYIRFWPTLYICTWFLCCRLRYLLSKWLLFLIYRGARSVYRKYNYMYYTVRYIRRIIQKWIGIICRIPYSGIYKYTYLISNCTPQTQVRLPAGSHFCSLGSNFLCDSYN
jgi:hypothetical protein